MFDNLKADIDRYVAYIGQSKLKLLLSRRAGKSDKLYRFE